jgi:hypothetical protein
VGGVRSRDATCRRFDGGLWGCGLRAVVMSCLSRAIGGVRILGVVLTCGGDGEMRCEGAG